ncbi:MAG: SOS response-associated peptidase [Syntrophomonadaceae bacterium]|nr:SOS response-associated peptidase [Syntrophomonadaceae bacterium]
MCGRFTITSGLSEIAARFNCERKLINFQPRYNVAPTQQVPVVINSEGNNLLEMMRWGLVPNWVKDPSIGIKMINARAETVTEKPVFKTLFRKKRCIIPADGYYEWQKVGKSKIPMRIVHKSRGIFALAGLWDVWQPPNGESLFSFTILTTEPVNSVQAVHNRMPVILRPENEQLWLNNLLNSPSDNAFLLSLIEPVQELEAYRVSTLVNSPANDRTECILPIY